MITSVRWRRHARLNSFSPGVEALFHIILGVFAACCILPFLFVVIISFSSEESIRQIGKAPSQMNKEEKKQVLSQLDRKGALLITRSGPKICQALGISKFTLYNYLEEIHKQQEGSQEE